MRTLIDWLLGKSEPFSPVANIQATQSASPQSKPAAPPAAVVARPPAKAQLHQPLLNAMRRFPSRTLPKGTTLFHGSLSTGSFADVEQKLLRGTRKWLSQDVLYAAGYGFTHAWDGRAGHKLLWICETSRDIPGLVGRQSSLVPFSPWDSSFPWMFPDHFKDYADEILGGQGPKCLLDHESADGYGEILLMPPEAGLSIIDVVQLPESKEESDALVREMFGLT